MVGLMNRTMTALLIALAATSAPAAAAERRYPVTDFDRLVVEGPYVVHLIAGRPSAAAASGTIAGLDRVSIDVQGGTLRIRRNRSAWGGTPGADTGTVTVTLATRILRSARLIGPGAIEIDGARGLNVELVVQGGGRMVATALAADQLRLGLLGGGTIELGGTAGVLTGDFQGTGSVEAAGLVARQATVTSNTSGAVALTVNGPATINANGLGRIAISGRAVCTVAGPGADQVSCPASNQR